MSTTLNMITLRQGSTADLGIVDMIMQRAFDPRYGEAWSRAQCLGMLAMPGVWLTIAELNGQPAGFALTRASSDEAELLLLAALPDMQRRGVGGALLRSVVCDCLERDVTNLYLEVRAGNDALNLYQTTGFTKVGERRSYYRGPGGQIFDALTYHRKLR